MKGYFLLGEVSRVLGRKPHQIVHLLVTGKIPEPHQRIGNKRLFTADDVSSLARHFKVAPDWNHVSQISSEASTKAPERLVLRPPFEVIQDGETSHLIKDGEGEIFGWAWDRGHALIMAGLLDAAARG